MGQQCKIDVKFYCLPEEIADCFTAISLLEVSVPQGLWVADLAPPEWAAMRFTQTGSAVLAGSGKQTHAPVPVFSGCGPTSTALRYEVRELRGWGIGVQPLGWALYSDVPAASVADRITDGMHEHAFRRFRELSQIIGNGSNDSDELAEQINRFLISLKPSHTPARAQILACHAALCDPDIGTVEALCDASQVSRRTLERLTARYFGYSPKLLLRRQRFLRSLAAFMLAGHEHWSEAIDRHYCDQAHFVKDFHRFMGMTPSEYAEMPHPVLERVVAQRMADQGAVPPSETANAAVVQLAGNN